MGDKCVQCGQTRERIKLRKMFCATVTHEGETDYEWPRHRFKPYSEKELARMKADEDEHEKYMEELAREVEG